MRISSFGTRLRWLAENSENERTAGDGFGTAVIGRGTAVNGQWTAVNVRWTAVNGRWTAVNGRWTPGDGLREMRINKCEFSPAGVKGVADIRPCSATTYCTFSSGYSHSLAKLEDIDGGKMAFLLQPVVRITG
ncbi:unnamed protein product, partial [Nesidiocoris tenuis]